MKDSSQGPRTDWKVPIDPFVLREEDGSYEEQEEIESQYPEITLEEARKELAEVIEANDRAEDWYREGLEEIIEDYENPNVWDDLFNKRMSELGMTLDEEK